MMSNVIDLTTHIKPNNAKTAPMMDVEIDQGQLEYIIDILTTLADEGSCSITELAEAFVTLGDIIQQLMPMFDAIVESETDD
jgi:hypothetical protein